MRTDQSTHLYDKNVAMVYDYGYKKKLVLCKTLRKKGFEVDTKPTERGTIHGYKLDASLIRTRSTIFELAYCNPWTLFITLTLNPKKWDRTDLKGYQKSLTRWIRYYNQKHGLEIKYLLVPELHDDGESWHMHGFLMGLPESHLVENDNGFKDWLPYREKFGYMSLDSIRSHEGVSKYITKYVTKDMSKSVSEVNANMYYCSKGLNRKILIKKGTLQHSVPWDFKNDFVHVKWYGQDTPVELFIDEVKIDDDVTIQSVVDRHLEHIKELKQRQLYQFSKVTASDQCPFK